MLHYLKRKEVNSCINKNKDNHKLSAIKLHSRVQN
uniref:Uncharacterized protein n=1 Tax=Rhizophora mucronata TaxID=61149 RepID=A0A2P2PWA6_RHIMU